MPNRIRQWAYRVIQRLYWGTEASTQDSLLKEGIQRAWLAGYETETPKYIQSDSTPQTPIWN